MVFLDFIVWLSKRDQSKWYTLSMLDIALFTYIGGMFFFTKGAENAALGGVFILVLNAVQTYFHNKNKSEK